MAGFLKKIFKEEKRMKKSIYLVAIILILMLAMTIAGCNSTPATSSQSVDSIDFYSYFKEGRINQEEPIMMRDGFMELMGQIDGPIPYYYQEVVKYAGHHCAATAGAWNIAKKALAALYPDGEVPERGKIKIYAPEVAHLTYSGVFTDIFEFITGATHDTGYPGSSFGPNYNRQGLIVFPDEPTGTPLTAFRWTWERIDTGAKVEVTYNPMHAQPPSGPDLEALQGRLGSGDPTVTEAEYKDWMKKWNNRANFVLDNHDKIPGFFFVEKLN